MSDSDAQITVGVSAEQAQAALTKLQQKASAMNNQFSNMKMVGAQAGQALLNLVPMANVAGSVINKLADAFQDLLKQSSKLIMESRKFGIPVEEMQKFKGAAEAAGVPAGTLTRAMKGLFKELASSPSSSKGKVLEQYGISREQIKKMMDDGAYGVRVVKQIYQSLDDAAKQKFGTEMFGGGYFNFKPFLEQTEEADRLAEAFATHMTQSQVAGFDDLNKSLERFDLLLVKLMSALESSGLNMIFAGWVSALILVVGAITLLSDAFSYIFQSIKAKGLQAIGMFYDLKRVINEMPFIGNKEKAEEAKYNSEKYSRRGEELQKRANKDAGRAFKEDFNDMMTGLEAEGRVIKTAWRNKTGGKYVVDNLQEDLKQLQRKNEDYNDVIKGLEQERSQTSDEERRKEIDKQLNDLREEKADVVEEISDIKKQLTVDYKLVSSGEGHYEDPKEKLKKFKEEQKKWMEERENDEKNPELTSKEKLSKVEEDINHLKEIQNQLSVDEVSNKQELLVIQEELNKKIKEQLRLKGVIIKEEENEQKEQEKLADMTKNAKLKAAEVVQKDKEARMKQAGASPSEIAEVKLADKMEKVRRAQKEYDESIEKSKARPKDNRLREDVIKNKDKITAAIGEANMAGLELTGLKDSSVASSAAKKGMGGGVALNPVAKLTDIAREQLEQTKKMVTLLDKFSKEPPDSVVK